MSWAAELLALKLWWRRLDYDVQAGQGLSLFVGLLATAVLSLIGLGIFIIAKFNQDVPAISQLWLLILAVGYFSFGLLWGLAKIGRVEQGIWRYTLRGEQSTAALALAGLIAIITSLFFAFPFYLGTQTDLPIYLSTKLVALKALAAWSMVGTFIGISAAVIIRRAFSNFLLRTFTLIGLIFFFYWAGNSLALPLLALAADVLFGNSLTTLLVLAVALVCLVASTAALGLLLMASQRPNPKERRQYWFFRLGDSSYFASFSATAAVFTTGLLLQLRDRALHQRILICFLFGAVAGSLLPIFSALNVWLLGLTWAVLTVALSYYHGMNAASFLNRQKARPVRETQFYWGFWWSSLVTVLPLGILLTIYAAPGSNYVLPLLAIGVFGLLCHAVSFWIGYRWAQQSATPLKVLAKEGIGALVLATTGLLSVILAIFYNLVSPLITGGVLLVWAAGLSAIWLGALRIGKPSQS